MSHLLGHGRGPQGDSKSCDKSPGTYPPAPQGLTQGLDKSCSLPMCGDKSQTWDLLGLITPAQGLIGQPHVGAAGRASRNPTFQSRRDIFKTQDSHTSERRAGLQNARLPNFGTQGRQRPRLKGLISEARRVAPPRPWARPPRRLEVVR